MMIQELLSKDWLPNFTQFTAETLEAEVLELIAKNRLAIDESIASCIKNKSNVLLEFLELLDIQLNYNINILLHMKELTGKKEYAEALERIIPHNLKYRIGFFHDKSLYQLLCTTKKSLNFNSSANEQKRVIECMIKGFKLQGVHLKKSEQVKLTNFQNRLAELAHIFLNNIYQDLNSSSLFINDKNLLAGLPNHFVESLALEAKSHNKTGWLIKLYPMSYDTILNHAHSRELRRLCYLIFHNIASPNSKNPCFNNHDIIVEILSLRSKISKIFKFKNFAEYSLKNKVLQSPEKVLQFLEPLTHFFKEQARQELSELEEFAKFYDIEVLEAWDISYLKNQLFNKYDSPKFLVEIIYQMLFILVKKLFSIQIEEEKKFDSWHEDVRLFNIFDSQNMLVGRFYVDLFYRKEKQPGAWCSEIKCRVNLHNFMQIPVACVVTNLEKIDGERGISISHEGLIIFLHEFGHCLQKCLTKINYPSIAGDNGIPLDATELVSQFMENFGYQNHFLNSLLKNCYKDDSLKEKILQCQYKKNFDTGIKNMQNIELALFDLYLHMEEKIDKDFDVLKFFDKTSSQLAVFPFKNFNRSPYQFLHIFSNVFAAGYYSYLYCDVLAADSFHCVMQDGVINQEVSHIFSKTFLESGGCKDPLQLFKEFSGRLPDTKSLFRMLNLNTRPAPHTFIKEKQLLKLPPNLLKEIS